MKLNFSDELFPYLYKPISYQYVNHAEHLLCTFWCLEYLNGPNEYNYYLSKQTTRSDQDFNYQNFPKFIASVVNVINVWTTANKSKTVFNYINIFSDLKNSYNYSY